MTRRVGPLAGGDETILTGRAALGLVLGLLVGLSGCVAPWSGNEPGVAGPRPLVASSHPAATEAGLAVLRAGGNAVDAAAAVQFALNVVEPMMSGIGGGAFVLVYNADKEELLALDGRETAPAAATARMFQQAAISTDVPARERGIAVGVPGTLAVWDEALRRAGTWSLADVIDPAVALAEGGVEVDDWTSATIASQGDKLRRWPAAAAVFLVDVVCPPQEASQVAVGAELVIVACDGGRPLAPGERLVQPGLARALRLIQDDGVAAFYQGRLGEAVVAAQASRGGVMTMQDLHAYAVEERPVLQQAWRGRHVATFGFPSGGPVLQETLAIVEPLAVTPRTDPDAAHRLIEALHLAFADRAAYAGDPLTARATSQQLLDAAFIESRRALIDDARTHAPYPPGDPGDARPAAPRDPVAPGVHTTHFTVMDARGNIVAATSTIESAFGSGMLVPEFGFMLNNEMTDFDLGPGGPNEIGPGKRPLSSMTPTIVFDADGPVFALGSPGGSTIVGTVLQVLVDVLADGTPLQDAVDAPRWAARLRPELVHEPDLDRALRDEIERRGSTWDETTYIGGVQAIHRDPERGWVAAADPRRAGAHGSL